MEPNQDREKFTRYFVIKAVQVIVQSRIVGGKNMKTECKPCGNDWFNINITDIAELAEQTKAILDSDGFSIRSNWRVCCEISIKTNDGNQVILEHWILSNYGKTSKQTRQTSPTSSIYNRMSLLLKTIVTTAHIVPGYRLASRATPSDSNVICHRVYLITPSNQNPEDINSSFGSIDMREFVGPDDLDNFCPIIKLGSVNGLEVSLSFRNDAMSSYKFSKSPRHDQCLRDTQQDQTEDQEHEALKPLEPAFAANDKAAPDVELMESAFEKLWPSKGDNNNTLNKTATTTTTKPVLVPSKPIKSNNLAGSTPKSLTDSFVFVDLNPPFASEEQNDINAFFHGPAPAFCNGVEAVKDSDELTSQLAVIEANATQIDEFIDNICATEDEEDDEKVEERYSVAT